MEFSWLMAFIVVVILIAVVGFVMKSFAKMVLLLGIIYLLFNLGFIWGVDDLNEKLHLNKILKPAVNEKLNESYGDFSKRRDETGVIESKLIQKTIRDTIHTALNNASNKIENVDKKELAKNLQTKLKSFNQKDVDTALKDFDSELKKYGISKKDISK